MNQRIANLLAEEQHEHGADCGQKDPTFGSDRVKTVEIRTGTVFGAVAGYQDQVVQGDQAADDTEGKTEHSFHETAAQMAVIGCLPGVGVICIVMGIYGNRHVIAVRVI